MDSMSVNMDFKQPIDLPNPDLGSIYFFFIIIIFKGYYNTSNITTEKNAEITK